MTTTHRIADKLTTDIRPEYAVCVKRYQALPQHTTDIQDEIQYWDIDGAIKTLTRTKGSGQSAAWQAAATLGDLIQHANQCAAEYRDAQPEKAQLFTETACLLTRAYTIVYAGAKTIKTH